MSDNTFNDYAQTFLLAAVYGATQQTNELLHQQASAAELKKWERVAKSRFPNITDPIDQEDLAQKLMAFDSRETAALDLLQYSFGLNKATLTIKRMIPPTFMGLIWAPGIWTIVFIVALITSSDWNDGLLPHMASGLGVAIFLTPIVIGLLYGASQADEEWNYAKMPPADYSYIFGKVYPGKVLRLRNGPEVNVYNWPAYETGKLRFRVKVVDRWNPGQPYMVSSEDILWDTGKSINNYWSF